MSTPETIHIKRHPNRQLYDIARNCYITLADLKHFIAQDTPFMVQDAKTGEDVTRAILLQMLLEQEEHQAQALTDADLLKLLRHP